MLVIAPMFCDIDSNNTSPTFNFMRDFFSQNFLIKLLIYSNVMFFIIPIIDLWVELI